MKTDYFAERAAVWDTPGKVRMADNFVNALLGHVELHKDWRGLEIGVGTGLVGLQMLPKIDSLVGVDTSKSMLEVFEKKVEGEKNVEIVFGELDNYVQKDIDFVYEYPFYYLIRPNGRNLLNCRRFIIYRALRAGFGVWLTVSRRFTLIFGYESLASQAAG